MEHFRDSFALAPDAQAFVGSLVASKPQLNHLTEARIVCVASQIRPRLHGADCNAFIIHAQRLQGPLRDYCLWLMAMFQEPVAGLEGADFLVIIDAAIWSGLDARRRERLMFHELRHIQLVEDAETGAPRMDTEGRPLMKLVPHDYEIFDDELREYGPVTCDVDGLAEALVEGHRANAHGGLRRVS